METSDTKKEAAHKETIQKTKIIVPII